MNIDRFSEAYYTLSPYAYAANLPTSLYDINGDYFTDPDGHIKRLKNRVGDRQKQNGKRINSLDDQIASAQEAGKDTSKLENERDNLISAQAELSGALAEISILEDSSQEYKVGTSVSEGSNGSFGLSENGLTANINFKESNGNDKHGFLLHELKHAFQYEIGQISLKPGGVSGSLRTLEDETEAFRREFAFSDADNLSKINPLYVKSRGRNSKNSFYQRLPVSITLAQRNGYLSVLRRNMKRSVASNQVPNEVVRGWQKLKKKE